MDDGNAENAGAFFGLPLQFRFGGNDVNCGKLDSALRRNDEQKNVAEL